MSGYLVLARKYRSTTFDEVVGQEAICRTLVNAIKTGRVHHAYLFTGTRGVGKTTTARILAKALNCLASEGPTPEPCGKCDACVAIARGDDMDVVEIDGASNRGIDEIRELRANAIFRPARSRYKIYYIDEVHQITRDAFNALLKTLEEPPGHVKFIFATTEVEKVPATIVSRCQRFDFRNIPTREIAGHLKSVCEAEKVHADDAALFRISRAAAGSMRDGLSLLDQLLAAGPSVTDADVVRVLGTPPDERMLAMAAAVAEGAPAAALGELNAVLESGVSLSTAAAALGDVFRNLMIASVCGEGSDLIEMPEQQRKVVGELSKLFSTPALVQSVGICQSVLQAIKGSSVARALVEAALVRLADAEKFVDPGSLIERLESIATGRSVGGEKKKPIGLPASPASRPGAPVSGTHAPGGLAGGAGEPCAAGPARPVGSVDEPASQYQGRPPVQAAAPAQSPAGLPRQSLSSAEVNGLAKDPAVKAVVDAFGGKIDHYELGQPMLFAPPPEAPSAKAQAPTPHQEPLHDDEDED